MATESPVSQPETIRRQRRRAVVASTVGTAIEWYDFFLYGTAAALIFPHLFFPGSSPYVGILASFGTQFVGFAARPIGAAIFGHFGDRVGRKSTLVTTLMLMGVSTFLIGLLPTFFFPLKPNARRELRLEAEARHERTLAAVACTPWFGAAARLWAASAAP